MTNDQFLSAIDDKEKLHVLLIKLAENLIDKYINKYDFEFEEDAAIDAANLGVIKSYKFKKHCNALNFFTTITMCFLRQIVRNKTSHHVKCETI
jgi:hypothetical protein